MIETGCIVFMKKHGILQSGVVSFSLGSVATIQLCDEEIKILPFKEFPKDKMLIFRPRQSFVSNNFVYDAARFLFTKFCGLYYPPSHTFWQRICMAFTRTEIPPKRYYAEMLYWYISRLNSGLEYELKQQFDPLTVTNQQLLEFVIAKSNGFEKISG